MQQKKEAATTAISVNRISLEDGDETKRANELTKSMESVKVSSPDASKTRSLASTSAAIGGNVTQAMMHEDEEEDHFGIGLDNQDGADDPKRKFLFARQLTHYFEDNPPLPLLPKSMIRRSESPRTGG